MFAKPNSQKVAVMDYEKNNEDTPKNEQEGNETPKEKPRYRKDYSEEDKALEEWDRAARAKENGEDTTEEPEAKGEEQTWKKRYGDARKHMNELQAQLRENEEKISELTKLASQKQELQMPTNEEELAEWAGKNPRLYDLFRSVAIKEYKKGHDEIQKGLKDVRQKQAEVDASRAEAILMRLHPDFDTIREDDSFHEWMSEQPINMQDAIYKNNTDAAAASRVIDLYKFEKGITKKHEKTTSKDVTSAAEAVKTKGAPKTGGDDRPLFSESQIANMSPQEYEKNEKAILDAMKSGRVDYDITQR